MIPPELESRAKKIIVKNRKAYHDFEITQTIEAGIVLQGTEVKALREGKCTIADAYAMFPKKEHTDLQLLNLHIGLYEQGNRENHEPKRPRKLLVSRREALKLFSAVQERGFTLIPLSVYFSGQFVKIELGLAKAKKKFDKREDEKSKESKKEIRTKYRY
jgi:SsrA-binding protein